MQFIFGSNFTNFEYAVNHIIHDIFSCNCKEIMFLKILEVLLMRIKGKKCSFQNTD